MKKIYTIILLLALVSHAYCQTMNVCVGNVTYAVAASQTGDMPYTQGTQVEILGKVFDIAEMDRIYIDNTDVADNTVDVTYNGTEATVVVAGNIMRYLTVSVDGAHVSISQDNSLATEITYTLNGSTTNGSFYMDGKYKATIVLNGVSITNPSDAAINIQNGKRIAITLPSGTTSTLTDGASGSQKGCFVVKGHAEFDGKGTLNITGNKKHAYWGKEYVQLKKGAGTINILGSQGDGINVNQFFQQNGGTVTMKNIGDDGIQVSYKTDDDDVRIPLAEDEENTGEILIKGGNIDITVSAAGSKGIKSEGPIIINDEKSAPVINIVSSGDVKVENNDSTSSVCMKSDSLISINAGTVTLTNTGVGGRAMACDLDINFAGGMVTARSEGQNYGTSSTGGGGGPGGGGPGGGGPGGGGPGGGNSSDNTKNAKCIKAKGNLNITGGTLNAYSAYHEAIESKAVLTISGGIVYAMAGDDAINSTGDMYVTGGTVYAYSTSNDALDANGNMYLQGGTVMAFGGSGAETGIDIDEQHNLYISGGEIFAIGGRIDSRFGSATQAYGYTTRSASFSGSYIVLSSSSGERIFAVKTPKTSYNGIVLCSSAKMAKSTTYSVGASSSVSGEEVNGFIASPTVTSVSGSTTFTAR